MRCTNVDMLLCDIDSTDTILCEPLLQKYLSVSIWHTNGLIRLCNLIVASRVQVKPSFEQFCSIFGWKPVPVFGYLIGVSERRLFLNNQHVVFRDHTCLLCLVLSVTAFGTSSPAVKCGLYCSARLLTVGCYIDLFNDHSWFPLLWIVTTGIYLPIRLFTWWAAYGRSITIQSDMTR